MRRGQITVPDHGGIELANTAGAAVEGARRAQALANAEPLSEASATPGRIIVADDWDTLFEFLF